MCETENISTFFEIATNYEVNTFYDRLQEIYKHPDSAIDPEILSAIAGNIKLHFQDGNFEHKRAFDAVVSKVFIENEMLSLYITQQMLNDITSENELKNTVDNLLLFMA